jgi:hypothetical protein
MLPLSQQEILAMKFKHLLIINGTLAIIAGLFVAQCWRLALGWVTDLPSDWNNASEGIWVLGSSIRMLGVAFICLGVVLLAVRRVSSEATRRELAGGLVIAYSFATLFAGIQQIAIWETTTGWLIVGTLALLAIGYGYIFGKELMSELLPSAQSSKEPEEITYNLKQIRYVTQNYSSLQGLKLLPLGLWLLFISLFTSELRWVISTLLLAIVLTWLVGIYYNRQFGQVRSLSSPSWKFVLVGLLALALLAASAAIDHYVVLPVSLLGLTIAMGLIVSWLQPAYRPRLHYPVMALLIAGTSVLPLLGIAPGNPTLYPIAVLYMSMMLFLLIGGLFDHLLLVRAFKALPEEEDHE